MKHVDFIELDEEDIIEEYSNDLGNTWQDVEPGNAGLYRCMGYLVRVRIADQLILKLFCGEVIGFHDSVIIPKARVY